MYREKDLLNELDHPFIIKLLNTTADAENLYFVFENCSNGCLADIIAMRKCLDLETTRLFTAQMVQTLAYLQTKEVMHRDLKPQNLLIDKDFNIKFIDFGDAKKEGEEPLDEEPEAAAHEEDGEFTPDFGAAGDQERRGTFVGTVNYLAPEMIKECESSTASDLWALGCIVFKMITGKVPFPGMSPSQVYPKILNRDIEWPEKMEIDSDCRDLIERLLQIDPKHRLGCFDSPNDMKALQSHKFLQNLDFSKPLTDLPLKEALAKSESSYGQTRPATKSLNGKFEIRNAETPVLTGSLLKKNKFYMKQERSFFLFPDGKLKYFDKADHKGTMQLSKASKARKVAKTDFEISLPDCGKTYYLI